MSDDRPLSACLFGVPGSEYNLGVGALRLSAAYGVLRRAPKATVTVFDDGWGVRPGEIVVNDEKLPIRLCGARRSRRFHRRESYVNMRVSAALGGAGNDGVRLIDDADAVLDVSGGDSFSDLYGAHRYQTVAWPKRLALLRRRPLILLPQTYGPFKDRRLERSAARLTSGASLAWARDLDSYAALQALLGDDFDAERHRLGVDMAFGLPASPAIGMSLPDWYYERDGRPVVGVNISSLVALDSAAQQHYGLRVDYGQLIQRLLVKLLDDGCRVVLVPHVIGNDGGLEADNVAQERIAATLPPAYSADVALSQPVLDPMQTKALIGSLDWFCGTRMHSTIAGLSSGVPTAAIAYSYKTRGVFETVQMGECVVDARSTTTDDAVDRLFELYTRRDASRARLAQTLPDVLARAEQQMDEIVGCIGAGARTLETA